MTCRRHTRLNSQLAGLDISEVGLSRRRVCGVADPEKRPLRREGDQTAVAILEFKPGSNVGGGSTVYMGAADMGAADGAAPPAIAAYLQGLRFNI